ncbi:DUF1003 domain-containing protein [Bradyrhizobium sp. NBAIM03]|nr:DUF1003 domain-containing protein [Bradyrhizobium sp. NBAIM16]MCA1506549.1 DUF1003 domain-containing protein [Bradyrhizobium sp. NBAIM02]MCA1533453.1 DUF1003 domain-containing protein [Bradyrhizobium sp. NBAIM03]
MRGSVFLLPLTGTASPAGRCRGVHNDITHDSGEGLSPTLERNIQALVARRRREQQAARGQDKVADAITAFTGSMIFVYLHLALFGFWIIANLHWIPGIPAWDESFVMLAMIASVEAIFLSTFVLISQNRMTAAADKRADLDLQISLLAEHELTKVARLLTQVAERLDVKPDAERDLQEAARDIAPERVLDKIEETRS